MDPNILGNFQVCISVPLIIAEWRPGLQVRDSMYSEAGPRGTIRVGWLNLQPLNGFSARALGGFWSDEHAERVGHSHGLGWLFGLILGSGGNCMCADGCYLHSSGFAGLWLPPIVVSVGAPKHISMFSFNEFRNEPKLLVIITFTFDIFLLMVLI